MKIYLSSVAVILGIIATSCSLEEPETNRYLLYEKLASDTDFIQVLQKTDDLIKVYNQEETNLISSNSTQLLKEDLLKDIKSRYSLLTQRFAKYEIEELGLNTLRYKGSKWLLQEVFPERSLVNNKAEDLTCGGICSSDNLDSCHAGCTWSAANCVSSGGPDYLCVSSYNLCVGDCCTYLCDYE